MNLHELKNKAGSKQRKKRVGNGMGSGRGKTCCAGHKGQLARKGHKRKIGFEGGQMRLIRRLPKIGFDSGVHKKIAVVNISALNDLPDGTEVTPDLMREKKFIKGPAKIAVKILGGGKLSRKLVVKAHAFSESAKGSIESAGGKCEVLGI